MKFMNNRPDWYKTTRKEVFNFITMYASYMKKETGISGIYPQPKLISLKFGISSQRASQYLQDYRNPKF